MQKVYKKLGKANRKNSNTLKLFSNLISWFFAKINHKYDGKYIRGQIFNTEIENDHRGTDAYNLKIVKLPF